MNIQRLLIGICLTWISCWLSGCGREEEVFLFSGEAARQETDGEISEVMSEISGAEDTAKIVVYLCGAVEEPGVYELSEGSRINDAVQAAGGFTEDAAVTSVNLAAKITDEDMICVLTREEAQEQSTISGSITSSADNGLININTADLSVLCRLPGIGESKARDIITYREKNGTFQKKEDIMQVNGIKENLYQQICDLISVK